MNRASSLVLLAALVVSTGCYKYAIKVGSGGNTSAAPARSEWTHHFLWGVVGEKSVDTASACNGSPNATIVIERNIVDGLLFHAFGEGLWSPSTVEIYCGATTAQVELDRDAAVAFVQSDDFLDVVAEVAPERLADATEARERLLAP